MIWVLLSPLEIRDGSLKILPVESWISICLCLTPRRRVPEGQVWAVRRAIEPDHSSRAVHEWREHPVRGGHGAAGGWIQTFSQQEEICHRYLYHPYVPDTGVFNASTTQPARVLFCSLGRYMADCWGNPPLWFSRNKNTKVGDFARLSWTSGSIWAFAREARISLQ